MMESPRRPRFYLTWVLELIFCKDVDAMAHLPGQTASGWQLM